MKITEENARANWCPMVRGAEIQHCLGSLCMAWRWAPDMFRCSECGAIFDIIYPCHQCKEKGGEMLTYRTGYCGFAGVPVK